MAVPWVLIFLTGIAIGVGILVVAFAVHSRSRAGTRGFEVKRTPGGGTADGLTEQRDNDHG